MKPTVLRLLFVVSCLGGVLAAIQPNASVEAAVHTMERVSVASSGAQSNNESYGADISADGRYIAFSSYATNLVPNDTNDEEDVFFHDRQTGTTIRVNVATDGTQANGVSHSPSISADGRYVAYQSRANMLVPDDTNESTDVFVVDLHMGTVERVSVSAGGEQGNDSSYSPSISGDGRYVAFVSASTNLVPNDTNDYTDVFVYDRQNNTVELISKSDQGVIGNERSSGPDISADGRYVAFQSLASNLVSDDTNGTYDVFVHDTVIHHTQRVSLSNENLQADGLSQSASISADGSYIAYASYATNLVPGDNNDEQDIFVSRRLGGTERVSVSTMGLETNDNSYYPSISADGRYVAFHSFGANLVPGDEGHSDIFVYDRYSDMIEWVTAGTPTASRDGASYSPAISADGRYVAFESVVTNFVSNDTNAEYDVFVADVTVDAPLRLHPSDGRVLSPDNAVPWPHFTFRHVEGVQWYQIWIGAADYSSVALYTWFPAFDTSSFAEPGQGICDAETEICTLPNQLWLENGDYAWWMTTWSDGETMDQVNAAWTRSTFTVGFELPSATVQAGIIFDSETGNPSFIAWEPQTNTFWYHIWVGPADYSATMVHEWIDISAGTHCDENFILCLIDVEGIAFPDDVYEIWIEVWGPGGYHTFTDMVDMPITATVPEAD